MSGRIPCCRSDALNSDNPIPPSRSAAATILVVEDDRAIRYLLTRVLEAAGYAVIACEDGVRGLAMICAGTEPIDAVITDSLMPGMDGRELLARIRALRSDLPVLVVSGSVGDRPARPEEDRLTVRLCKPVSPDRLKLELQTLLSRCAEGGTAQPSMR